MADIWGIDDIFNKVDYTERACTNYCIFEVLVIKSFGDNFEIFGKY